ncbi:MAG: response regulator [Kiritimatiellae bacterium]|nr:response regulator [Kiritimatiellia bacterium]MDD5523173.1 response regulator [Kiritimatiellia bacterium]
MNAAEKERILLVDDEKHLLISLRDYLLYENFDVTIAQSGEEALEKLKKLTPDLIVLDISMPGLGGLGFLKRISSEEGKPMYPVLVLTARSMMADFFGNLDVDGFLAKPCDEATLASKIRAIISKRKAVSEKRQRTVKKVTIAEDDAVLSHKLTDAFETAGYSVTVVTNGPEVLEKAAAERPDVLLMKEILPRLNGSAVAALIEVMPSLNSTSIILYDDSRQWRDGADTKFSRLKCIKQFLPTSDVNRLLKAVQELLT